MAISGLQRSEKRKTKNAKPKRKVQNETGLTMGYGINPVARFFGSPLFHRKSGDTILIS